MGIRTRLDRMIDLNDMTPVYGVGVKVDRAPWARLVSEGELYQTKDITAAEGKRKEIRARHAQLQRKSVEAMAS